MNLFDLAIGAVIGGGVVAAAAGLKLSTVKADLQAEVTKLVATGRADVAKVEAIFAKKAAPTTAAPITPPKA